MNALIISFIAGAGIYLLFTAIVFRQSSLFAADATSFSTALQNKFDYWFTTFGLERSQRCQFLLVITATFVVGVLFGWFLFGGYFAPLLVGSFVATFPVAHQKQKRMRVRNIASATWPRMIEEIRLMCGSLGRPIPQALLEVGKAGPEHLRFAFIAAEREWLISTDFDRTVSVLKEKLTDPTVDTICETLLLAHSVGGSEIEKRLFALANDRQRDLNSRRDAQSKQSGVIFARRFVLIVPLGMALAGLSIGDGRAAYATPSGQIGVTLGLFILVFCWWWAGKLIRLPEDKRVFDA